MPAASPMELDEENLRPMLLGLRFALNGLQGGFAFSAPVDGKPHHGSAERCTIGNPLFGFIAE